MTLFGWFRRRRSEAERIPYHVLVERGNKGPNYKWYLSIRRNEDMHSVALVFGSSATRQEAVSKAWEIVDELRLEGVRQ